MDCIQWLRTLLSCPNRMHWIKPVVLKSMVLLLPLGSFNNIWKHFWLSQMGFGMLLHSVGGGQGCHNIPSAQDSPQQSDLAHNIRSAQVEKIGVKL